MKPLKKAVKVALDANKPVQEAVNKLLTDHSSTTHPAIGSTLNDMFFEVVPTPSFPESPNQLSTKLKKLKYMIRSKKQRPMQNKISLNGESIRLGIIGYFFKCNKVT